MAYGEAWVPSGWAINLRGTTFLKFWIIFWIFDKKANYIQLFQEFLINFEINTISACYCYLK